MCGIAGIHAPGGDADPRLVAAMAERMAHRGPDGRGSYEAPGIALGMRRLAIIDPQGGHQPLFNEREDVVAVFNGELYNHAELRAELERRGHRLRSGSDGEVIPHLYEEHGIGFVERLNGIFAIALWDARSQTLHLARDQFGVKPLYFSHRGRRLAFASEVRALLADPSVSRELDAAAIDRFLTFRFVPSPGTGLEGVRKLEPATVLSFGRPGLRTTAYATDVPGGNRTDRRLVEEYRAAFERAVARQMMSDRPIGVMLSGGVDSGAVCAAMARHATQVRAYTVGFSGGGARTDEIAQAAATARLFGAEHESVVIGEREYLEALPAAMAGIEEPVGTTSALAVRFVADLMRPSVPVALCGQGADEPLGGYGRHRGARLAELLRRLPGARAVAGRLPRPAGAVTLSRGLDALAARDDLGLLMNAYRLLRDPEKAALYRPQFAARVRELAQPSGQAVERLRARVRDRSPLGQMLYVDTRLWLPDELLLIADKMSMAASVELRVPFLDRDLVALAESAHPSQHVRRLRGKSLHKQAMLGLLPREIVHRRKLGWQTPVDRWLRDQLRPLAEEVLLGEGEACRSLFEERELRRLIEAHASGKADHTRQLFCLLSLGLWHRELVSERPAPPPPPTAVAAAPRPGTA